MKRLETIALVCVAAAALGGCSGTGTSCPRVIFLDGSGWYTGSGQVRNGLVAAGYTGEVERFSWSAVVLGPVGDHVLAQSVHPRVFALANRITDIRHANPDGRLVLMGYSAGAKIAVSALERLPEDVQVDDVVLLSPSLSSRHDLTKALMHVKGRLYATSSPHDSLLDVGSSAGLEGGAPAGERGFQPPRDADPQQVALYRGVVNIPWQPGYVAYGWTGGHLTVTSSDFIRRVIAPRIMADKMHPLDQVAANTEEW